MAFSQKAKTYLMGYAFASPFIFLFLMFVAYPLAIQIGYAFTAKTVGSPPVFNGLDNFHFILNFPGFNYVFTNIFLFAGVAVNIKMFLAAVMASILNQEFRGKKYFNAIFLLPWAVPMVPVLVTWRWILDADYGFINNVFALLDLPRIPFLARWETGIGMAMLFHIWRILPFYTLIVLGGIQAIPVEVYESAEIDGASVWTKFWKITLPLVKPVYLIALLLSTIWTLGDFTTIWILTRGAPSDTTNVFATFAYKFAFIMGNLGAAYASFVLLLPLVLVLIFALLRMIGE